VGTRGHRVLAAGVRVHPGAERAERPVGTEFAKAGRTAAERAAVAVPAESRVSARTVAAEAAARPDPRHDAGRQHAAEAGAEPAPWGLVLADVRRHRRVDPEGEADRRAAHRGDLLEPDRQVRLRRESRHRGEPVGQRRDP